MEGGGGKEARVEGREASRPFQIVSIRIKLRHGRNYVYNY